MQLRAIYNSYSGNMLIILAKTIKKDLEEK